MSQRKNSKTTQAFVSKSRLVFSSPSFEKLNIIAAWADKYRTASGSDLMRFPQKTLVEWLTQHEGLRVLDQVATASRSVFVFVSRLRSSICTCLLKRHSVVATGILISTLLVTLLPRRSGGEDKTEGLQYSARGIELSP
jgi:hypothetical protein